MKVCGAVVFSLCHFITNKAPLVVVSPFTSATTLHYIHAGVAAGHRHANGQVGAPATYCCAGTRSRSTPYTDTATTPDAHLPRRSTKMWSPRAGRRQPRPKPSRACHFFSASFAAGKNPLRGQISPRNTGLRRAARTWVCATRWCRCTAGALRRKHVGTLWTLFLTLSCYLDVLTSPRSQDCARPAPTYARHAAAPRPHPKMLSSRFGRDLGSQFVSARGQVRVVRPLFDPLECPFERLVTPFPPLQRKLHYTCDDRGRRS